jgi:glycosyltransferase involved in cell wall biosynthesis
MRLPEPAGAATPHLLFVVNLDWFFLSHRLPLARAARDAGWRVTVAAADTGSAAAVVAEGLAFVALPAGGGALGEARLLPFLARLYRRLRPDLIHHVTIRPVVFGTLAARAVPRAAVVNAVSGLGYVFTGDGRSRLLRGTVETLYRAALRRPRTRTIFQNPDDRAVFTDRGLVRPDDTVLIRGSGVDCARFAVAPEPPGDPVVMLPARLLWDKGIAQFVEAARLLRARGVPVRMVLAGDRYEGNPTSIPQAQLDAWKDEGVVEPWGHREDMAAALAQASVVVLPSRREGLPKALLEAAAVGRPLIATDVPGCREVVLPGVNGMLVPLDDAGALADAVEALVRDPALRRTYGAAAREMAEREFAVEAVVAQTMEVYRSLLQPAAPAAPRREAA